MPTGLAMALGITAVTKAPFFEAILLAQHSIVVPIQCLSPSAWPHFFSTKLKITILG